MSNSTRVKATEIRSGDVLPVRAQGETTNHTVTSVSYTQYGRSKRVIVNTESVTPEGWKGMIFNAGESVAVVR